MKIEHIAINVSHPEALAAWYVQHLGLEIIHHNPQANQTHFLSDNAGTLIEIYCNPAHQVPNYKQQDPLTFHLAFTTQNPETDTQRLTQAGATYIEEKRPNPNTQLIMLRDPWGIALQLCKRNPTLT